MARTGDEEGEGQEAQEGSRRLISRSQVSIFPIRPNILHFLSKHVSSTSHTNAIRRSVFHRARAFRF